MDYANPQAWEPNQRIENGIPLTRTDSFFAVLAPAQTTQIEDYHHYKELMAARIAEMIRQWSADQELELSAVYRMIQQRLMRDEVPEFETPRPDNETPESWGQAIANSAWLSAIWTMAIDPDYPLPMVQGEEREDAIATVEEQTLEEWLLLFSKQS